MIVQARYKYISYTLLTLFTVLPLLGGFLYALGYSFGVIGVLKTGFTTEHWATLFTQGNIFSSIFYSAIIAATSIVIAVFLAINTALLLSKKLQKGLLSYLIYIPLAFPGIVAAFFIFQLFSKSGFLARIAFQLHLIKDIAAFPDLINDQYGIGIICSFVFLLFPFFVLLFVNIIKTERLDNLKEAAATLNASPFEIWRRVSVPILLMRALPNLMLYFIFIFGAFEVPLILGRSNPEMISVLAVRKLQKFNLLDLPQGYAIAVLYTIFVFAIIILLFKAKNRTDEQ